MRAGLITTLGAVFALFANQSTAAEPTYLGEKLIPGDTFQYEINLTVTGEMKVDQNGESQSIPIQASAKHRLLERVEALDAKGAVGMGLRFYESVESSSEIDGDRSRRQLPDNRRLIVAQRSANGTIHYSPDGPLQREELELVAEHFDTLSVTGLLPNREVAIGDSWKISPDVAQNVCLLEGLTKNELAGKLVSVNDQHAHFTITGEVEGLEMGAEAKFRIEAEGLFDLKSGRLENLNWTQKDERGQGAASPATQLQVKVLLSRQFLDAVPKQLDTAARAKLPKNGKVPDYLLAISYQDPANRYRFLHDRNWHMVGRTRDHLILRYLEDGEFTAQATISVWQKVQPGTHTSPAEFKQVLAKLPGWQAEGNYAEAEIPTDDGRWLYRAAANGKQDGQAVVQVFYLLAGKEGHQVAVTVVTRPELANKLSPKDLTLVNSIELPAGK